MCVATPKATLSVCLNSGSIPFHVEGNEVLEVVSQQGWMDEVLAPQTTASPEQSSDRGLMIEVFINLLNNVTKFSRSASPTVITISPAVALTHEPSGRP